MNKVSHLFSLLFLFNSSKKMEKNQPKTAPETINRRLAMTFLLYGASLEASTNLPAAQLATNLFSDPLSADPKGLALALVVVVASLIPITKGAISEPFGVFTPRAERVNGRAAMLAIAAVLALESRAGGVPFF